MVGSGRGIRLGRRGHKAQGKGQELHTQNGSKKKEKAQACAERGSEGTVCTHAMACFRDGHKNQWRPLFVLLFLEALVVFLLPACNRTEEGEGTRWGKKC